MFYDTVCGGAPRFHTYLSRKSVLPGGILGGSDVKAQTLVAEQPASLCRHQMKSHVSMATKSILWMDQQQHPVASQFHHPPPPPSPALSVAVSLSVRLSPSSASPPSSWWWPFYCKTRPQPFAGIHIACNFRPTPYAREKM